MIEVSKANPLVLTALFKKMYSFKSALLLKGFLPFQCELVA
jgi:hypothetical protein